MKNYIILASECICRDAQIANTLSGQDKDGDYNKYNDFFGDFSLGDFYGNTLEEAINDAASYNNLNPEDLFGYEIKYENNSVYVVQILSDISHAYKGLDDTEIYLCDSFEEAKEKLESEYWRIKNEHFDYGNKIKEDEDYLEIDLCEFDKLDTGALAYMRITDGKDYFSGQILEKKVN